MRRNCPVLKKGGAVTSKRVLILDNDPAQAPRLKDWFARLACVPRQGAYLLRDRDQVYGEQFRHRVNGMRIEEVLTAPRF